jgi:hypothetical protein
MTDKHRFCRSHDATDSPTLVEVSWRVLPPARHQDSSSVQNSSRSLRHRRSGAPLSPERTIGTERECADFIVKSQNLQLAAGGHLPEPDCPIRAPTREHLPASLPSPPPSSTLSSNSTPGPPQRTPRVSIPSDAQLSYAVASHRWRIAGHSRLLLERIRSWAGDKRHQHDATRYADMAASAEFKPNACVWSRHYQDAADRCTTAACSTGMSYVSCREGS